MKIRLTDYTQKWATSFAEEVYELKSIFEDDIVAFEHFGSTAVPGMKAKPVIDIICIVKEIEKVDLYNERMKALSYEVAGEWGISGRRLFRKGGENRTHHLHFYQEGNPEIERHLIFRDYLLEHPEEVRKYSEFKEILANQYEMTQDYSPAKKAFVSEMENRAIAWYKNTNVGKYE
ncbi:GrpB family protein [Caldibacillus lycopersici]|uniref:GrpB family protein n=1 Tax=Perspicuibacillus lycopersici TaxID=1325689 RepID=A0AAE3IV08_9BACI|nr:GrpB family protein [Perspicuibacillus lycopersici]MCU9614962.1 GrpB family protein [Perspicuibacillus lycopersici]